MFTVVDKFFYYLYYWVSSVLVLVKSLYWHQTLFGMWVELIENEHTTKLKFFATRFQFFCFCFFFSKKKECLAKIAAIVTSSSNQMNWSCAQVSTIACITRIVSDVKYARDNWKRAMNIPCSMIRFYADLTTKSSIQTSCQLVNLFCHIILIWTKTVNSQFLIAWFISSQ